MLTTPFLKSLATKAQQLKPVVMIGAKGLTESVHQEIEGALLAHELIKIRMPGGDRDAKTALIESIVSQHSATLVQKIGHVITIYRKNPDAE